MKYVISFVVFIIIILNTTAIVVAKEPKAKFYDFNEQIIDGEIKKPMTLYTNSREQVKFERLLKLKKSFLQDLFDTAKESVFK
jgi:NADPH-dependent 7-cyano-7-deazaguanine reductase QueF-like protein